MEGSAGATLVHLGRVLLRESRRKSFTRNGIMVLSSLHMVQIACLLSSRVRIFTITLTPYATNSSLTKQSHTKQETSRLHNQETPFKSLVQALFMLKTETTLTLLRPKEYIYHNELQHHHQPPSTRRPGAKRPPAPNALSPGGQDAVQDPRGSPGQGGAAARGEEGERADVLGAGRDAQRDGGQVAELEGSTARRE